MRDNNKNRTYTLARYNLPWIHRRVSQDLNNRTMPQNITHPQFNQNGTEASWYLPDIPLR